MRDILPVPDVPVDASNAIPQAASLGAIVAAFGGWLPAIVAIIPAIYYLILIWQSATVQHAIRNWRMRRQARKLIRLKAKAKVAAAALEAEEVKRSARAQAKEMVAVAQAEAKVDAVHAAEQLEKKVPPV